MRVRRVFAVFAVGSIVALMAACLFPSLDALTQTSDAATDVFQTDASSDAADAKALTYTEEVLTDFPEMYLRLGESDGATIAVDTTGDNYAGDYPDAGCVLGVPGAIVNDPDTAVTFDGVHTIHVSPSFDFPNTSAFTIEVWALQTMYSDSGFTIDHEDWSDGRNGWDMLLDSTYVGGERWLEGGTHGSNTETDAGLTLGKFHHVVITFDGSAFCTYVDGAQLQCKPIAVEPIPSTGIGWAIGGNNNCGNCGSFVGTLDEFALYTHALSAARVAVHYHVGSGTP